MLLLFAILNIFRSNLLLPSLPTPALLHFLTINTPLFSYFQYIHFFLKAQCFLHCLFCRHWDLIKIISVFQVPDVLFYMRSAKQKIQKKPANSSFFWIIGLFKLLKSRFRNKMYPID